MRKKTITAVVALVMFVMTVALMGRSEVLADGEGIVIDTIDYDYETLTLKVTGSDSKLYFADSKTATKWETIPGEIKNSMITMDISWASKTKNVTFYIKGDFTTIPIQVTLPKQSTSFSASLNYSTNTVSFSGLSTGSTVYWRKSTSTTWTKLTIASNKSTESFADELERFYLQGITLYFKIGQIEGSSTNTGSRPSKEVSVKIAKRAAGPSVTVNYSALTINAKNTMEYKVGDDKNWKFITGTCLSLENLYTNILYEVHKNKNDDDAKKIEVTIDVRTKATSSKPASKAVTLTINGQKYTDDKNIILEYTGSAQLTLYVKTMRDNVTETITYEGASSSNQYEYTIVDKDKYLDIATASWFSITTSSGITISSSKAPKGSTIYVRKKATSNTLAGSCVSFPVADYPSEATLGSKPKILKIKGVDQNPTFVVLFDYSIKNTDNLKISSIIFEDTDKNNSGSVGFKQGNVVDFVLNGTTYHSITITINDFSNIETNSNLIDKQLYSRIATIGNGVIEGGVSLYISPAATMEYINKDGNIINSNVTVFKEMNYTPTSVSGGIYKISLGSKSKEDIKVTSITLGSYTFTEGTDYTVSSISNEDTINITMINTAFDRYKALLATSKIGKSYQLTVTLSNGEVLTSNGSIIVKSIISITSSNTSIVMSKKTYDSYLEDLDFYKKAVTANGTTNVLTEPVAPYTNPTFSFAFDDEFDDYDYGTVSLVGATWNGTNILDSGYTKSVVLDIKKIITNNIGTHTVYLIFNTDKGELTIPTSFVISVVN